MSGIFRYLPDNEARERMLSMNELDNIPYIDEKRNVLDHKNLERGEQFIAERHISSHDSVLELGGRFGTVSAIINNKLADPYKHVVIEPETAVIPCLLENRKTHNSYFTVYKNIICNKPKTLICAGHATRAVNPVEGSSESDIIPIITLKEIIDYHGFTFNVLVADCEGCLEEFIQDNMDFVRQLRLITFETDFPELCNYQNVVNILQGMGFHCVEQGFHMVWVK